MVLGSKDRKSFQPEVLSGEVTRVLRTQAGTLPLEHALVQSPKTSHVRQTLTQEVGVEPTLLFYQQAPCDANT